MPGAPNFLQIRYRRSAIISRSLYFFHPIFHCSLYCRAVYNAEWLILHDSFFSSQNKKWNSALFLLYLKKVAVHWDVYAAERFVLQESFLKPKIRDL